MNLDLSMINVVLVSALSALIGALVVGVGAQLGVYKKLGVVNANQATNEIRIKRNEEDIAQAIRIHAETMKLVREMTMNQRLLIQKLEVRESL